MSEMLRRVGVYVLATDKALSRFAEPVMMFAVVTSGADELFSRIEDTTLCAGSLSSNHSDELE